MINGSTWYTEVDDQWKYVMYGRRRCMEVGDVWKLVMYGSW